MALKGQEARNKQRKQKQGGKNEKKNDSLNGTGTYSLLKKVWKAWAKCLYGIENPSSVQKIVITMNWCYTFCHPDWGLDI